MEQLDIELKELNHFSGTENYYNVYGVNVTDGVKYLMDNGYAWFVTDAIIRRRFNRRLLAQEFLSVKLQLLPNSQAKTVFDDGNENVLDQQFYGYTNAVVELTLYLENGVLCLSGER